MSRHNPYRRKASPSIGLGAIVIACLATVLPGLAILKLGQSIRPAYLVAYLCAISVISFFLYGLDKKKAANEAWRIPERTLHLVELAGGWLAAYFAQRAYRHKTAKQAYQAVFWCIALIHNYVALDYLNEWRLTKAALAFIASLIE